MLILLSRTLFVLVLAFSCGNLAFAQHRAMATRPHSECNPNAPGAIISPPSSNRADPKDQTVVATSALRLVEAKYVEGPCVADIVNYVAGNARLSSGKIFVIRHDGMAKLFPPHGIVERHELPTEKIQGLPGYRLLMVERVGLRRTPAGERTIYVGLFIGRSDYVIARFDVLNGKPSRNAELLIRATSPIYALGFLPAPDTADGRIGFVQRAGSGKAWLYAYEWHHGPLQPLKF